jgi:hypothetical protein
MPIFAIALVPEGNILRQVREITSSSLQTGDSPSCRGLPEGIYLGFSSEGASGSKCKDLIRSFRKASDTIFAGLPPVLGFSGAGYREGKWYLVPDGGISDKVPAAAEAIASVAGFSPLESPPLSPGAGFFAGNDVTVPPFGAFSFRHLDAILYMIECDDSRYSCVRWTVLSRVARRTGPRVPSPVADR